MYDFANAAYAGHFLSQVTGNFGYFVPAARSSQPFYFHLTVYDFEKFTDTRCSIILGLNYEVYNNQDFEVNASLFLDEAYKLNLVLTAKPGASTSWRSS